MWFTIFIGFVICIFILSSMLGLLENIKWEIQYYKREGIWSWNDIEHQKYMENATKKYEADQKKFEKQYIGSKEQKERREEWIKDHNIF